MGWNGDSYPTKISAGDTLIINGEVQVGFDADGNSFAGTSSAATYDVYMKKVPSGVDANNKTKIYGSNYASCTGKTSTTKLVGKERTPMVINLETSNNVELKCLTITDGLDCAELHPNASVACERTTYPYGNWAQNGISAVDSENVDLNYVYVDGLATRGVFAGRIQNWTWTMGSISGNPYVGWEGDRGDPDDWANARFVLALLKI